MKITAFNGSPRAEQSNTNIIVQKFLEGAQSAGAAVDNVFLNKHHINHCNGCFSCWFKTPGQCIFCDDMQALLEKYKSSDIICFATPVYTWNMTALLKNFVDRLVPLRRPVVTRSGGDYDMQVSLKLPEAVVIANCGFPGESNFDTMKAVFRSAAPILEIYRDCGQLLKSNHNDIKAIVNEYLGCVKEAGFEITHDGKVSDNTKGQLQKELVSPQEYLKMINL